MHELSLRSSAGRPRSERDTTIPAGLLGLVERAVGAIVNACRRIVATKLVEPATDRDALGHAAAAATRALDQLALTLRDLERRIDAGCRQQQHELLAAEPGEKVYDALVLLEQPRDELRQAVAGVMPLLVVDSLEKIDVPDRERQRLAMPAPRTRARRPAPRATGTACKSGGPDPFIGRNAEFFGCIPCRRGTGGLKCPLGIDSSP